MEIINAIIHKLEKEISKKSSVIKREKILTIDTRIEKFFIVLQTVYNRKQAKDFGTFDSNKDNFTFQVLLKTYLNKDLDFVLFTHKAMDHFKSIIDSVTPATGGYVIFSHYRIEDERFCVIILSDKLEYAIDNETLNIKENISLDIDKLDVANFVNISNWNSCKSKYLSFARGKKDISQYFRKFIGCIDHKPSKETSEDFNRAFEDFLQKESIQTSEKDKIRQKVYGYCMDCIKEKHEIELYKIAMIVNESDPSKFIEFASQDNYSISSSFEGYKNTLNKIYNIEYKSKNLKLSFPRMELNHTIYYNSSDKSIKIINIPDELITQIETKK